MSAIGTSLDPEIIDLHSKGYGQKLIARMLSEAHQIEISQTNIAYRFKKLGLKPHIGSSNGGLALSGKTRIQKQVEDHHKSQRREMCQQYRGFKDLPLFCDAHVYKMRYRNDQDFRNKQIEKQKKWKARNPDKAKKSAKKYWGEWTERNSEKVKEIRRSYKKNPQNRIIMNMRKRLSCMLKGTKGYSKTAILKGIGCTRDELIAHIENQFKDGMSWDNYGEWHIDHIIPLASAKSHCINEMIENIKALNHYSNLQPLWAAENIAKGATIDPRLGSFRPCPGRVARTTA